MRTVQYFDLANAVVKLCWSKAIKPLLQILMQSTNKSVDLTQYQDVVCLKTR